ncbi:MAG: twin-arginine translocation signal domain-containing protein [Bacteroidales bacterium]|nr:twin-arginine translocation signal domain-containing protein [Bacteroidales bacterium]
MSSKSISRRNFLGKTAATTGLVSFGAFGISNSPYSQMPGSERLPREVWIATLSQMELKAGNSAQMNKMILDILEKAIVYKPDIICLPEVFPTSNLDQKLTLNQKVELSATAMEQFSSFAKQNNCYLICPVYTVENKKIYNSAVLFNRFGEKTGEYHKIHLTEGEINEGLTPGSLQPPVFKTDFGTIGIQICFDMLWDDGWKALRQQGAEITFWPSAYAGGKAVNAKAWQNKYFVVSSTRKNTSKICDISGDIIAQTGIWDKNLICAPVNLDKALLHTWPFCNRFDEIRAKYGRKIRITNYHEEEWSVIESLSPDVSVKDVLKEFDLKTHEQHTHDSEIAQNEARNKV